MLFQTYYMIKLIRSGHPTVKSRIQKSWKPKNFPFRKLSIIKTKYVCLHLDVSQSSLLTSLGCRNACIVYHFIFTYRCNLPLKTKVDPSAELKRVSMLGSAQSAGSSADGGGVVTRGMDGFDATPPPISVCVLCPYSA